MIRYAPPYCLSKIIQLALHSIVTNSWLAYSPAGAYPYAAAPVVYAEDDGSYFPGKYEGTGYPYAAPYVAAPYAAAPYVAAPYAAAPYAAVPYPYAAPFADDGSYFPGKYGPENQ